MSERASNRVAGAMLELWRPPQGAGDPIGCLATTYTFAPGLFDEQCLARFLEIGSEPDREDLAFLLERENRLGGVYAGVLVDHTQAGVEHSLRWDVLSVRVGGAKQHAKVSLLAWTHHVRVIVVSANLTEPGYRFNQEVASAVDLRPGEADIAFLADVIRFLRDLLGFVSGAGSAVPGVDRARAFLGHVEELASRWKPARRVGTLRQQLVCTLPSAGPELAARSSLDEAVAACRRRGTAPSVAMVASPFFDDDGPMYAAAAALCKRMARGGKRMLWICVPASRDAEGNSPPRLLAPRSLWRTPTDYQGRVSIAMLPERDEDGNVRPWHAKLLTFIGDSYSALMVGSSNFTSAGMGIGTHRNAEANLLSIVDQVQYGREEGALQALWPEMPLVDDPEAAEWLGVRPDTDEEEASKAPPLPAGFLPATYRAGERRRVVLQFEPAELPQEWRVHACGQDARQLINSSEWQARGCAAVVGLVWEPLQPPERLLVRWAELEAFLPLNVEDSRELPAPDKLERMTADDMLLILAAADPSAAVRAWARREHLDDSLDDDVDTAVPIDLDPLRRYDLRATFLHRVRHRARVLADLRANLERPVWGRQALEWRLRGLIGIASLADRLLREFKEGRVPAGEALLTLADFLILLSEVDYHPGDGSLPKKEFDAVFRGFLGELATRLERQVRDHPVPIATDLMEFWTRVVERCQS